jgi:hypothetical protein
MVPVRLSDCHWNRRTLVHSEPCIWIYNSCPLSFSCLQRPQWNCSRLSRSRKLYRLCMRNLARSIIHSLLLWLLHYQGFYRITRRSKLQLSWRKLASEVSMVWLQVSKMILDSSQSSRSRFEPCIWTYTACLLTDHRHRIRCSTSYSWGCLQHQRRLIHQSQFSVVNTTELEHRHHW